MPTLRRARTLQTLQHVGQLSGANGVAEDQWPEPVLRDTFMDDATQ
jgi:hypothetical protein